MRADGSNAAMTFLCFGHGSDMPAERLRARCPSAKCIGIAAATGYVPEFGKPGVDGSGKATLGHLEGTDRTSFGVANIDGIAALERAPDSCRKCRASSHSAAGGMHVCSAASASARRGAVLRRSRLAQPRHPGEQLFATLVFQNPLADLAQPLRVGDLLEVPGEPVCGLGVELPGRLSAQHGDLAFRSAFFSPLYRPVIHHLLQRGAAVSGYAAGRWPVGPGELTGFRTAGPGSPG